MADSAIASPSPHFELRQAWAGLPAWRALDSKFGCGTHFFSVWQTWRADPQAPHLLHYVALTDAPPSFEQLQDYGQQHPEYQNLIADLKAQWLSFSPGFHRLVLNEGRLLLTLCIGELRHVLREQQFEANSVFLDLVSSPSALIGEWDKWTVKALAICCQRGTLISLTSSAAPLLAELIKGGFQFNDATLWGIFNPHWTLKRSRGTFNLHALKLGTCAVIGAGLAGASVAAALAKRGWQVQVLDTAAAPASGASGLPVGLVVPHVSKDDCTQSRLSRSGVRLMLQQARQLLIDGQDWAYTGVLEKQLDTKKMLLQEPQAASIFHPQAAWLKPAQLVRAWLAQEGVSFRGQACVASLTKLGAQWQLLDTAGQELCRADRVVFANAGGAIPLLETLQATQPPDEPRLALNRLPSVQGMRGLISWGYHASTTASAHQNFPIMPVNGSGSMIPWVPVVGMPAQLEGTIAPAWFVGSSYQSEREPERPDAENHRANLARLAQLMPELAQDLAPLFHSGDVQHWKNTRCVTLDRLPLVGPLVEADDPSLWICAGMSSRGMSFSVLCAELLAAQWGREPLPLGATLAQSLLALRGRGKQDPTTHD